MCGNDCYGQESMYMTNQMNGIKIVVGDITRLKVDAIVNILDMELPEAETVAKVEKLV